MTFKLFVAGAGVYPPLSDETFPAHEQLPRKMIIRFEERTSADKSAVAVGVFWVKPDGTEDQIGDELIDTNYDKDGWGRYHDAAHVAMCLLGWSIHLRKFLGRKRRSNSLIKLVEDGPEAVIADEGIVFILINLIKKDNLVLESPDDVPELLVESAKTLFYGKELGRATDHEWQQVFCCMYQLMAKLREHKGGYIYVDLPNRKISFDTKIDMNFYG